MADGNLVPIQRSEVAVYQLSHTVSDMTEIAARAQVETAKMTHAVPACQETARTGIIVAAVSLLTVLGVFSVPAANRYAVVVTGLLVLGGAWGITETVKRLRKPPVT